MNLVRFTVLLLLSVPMCVVGQPQAKQAEFALGQIQHRHVASFGDLLAPESIRNCGKYVLLHKLKDLRDERVLFVAAGKTPANDVVVSRISRDIIFREFPSELPAAVIANRNAQQPASVVQYALLLPTPEYEKVRLCLKPKSVSGLKYVSVRK